MLTRPDIEDEEIVRLLWDAYRLKVESLAFLPLGADLNTAVYQVVASNKKEYFLKFRRGAFDAATVNVPKYLADLGMKQVIPPLETHSGDIVSSLASFKVILYPYVKGHHGIDVKLSDSQWVEFGATMKTLHCTQIPQALTHGLQRETFSSKWPHHVKKCLEEIQGKVFEDPIAMQMASFLAEKRVEILKCVQRVEELAFLLQKQTLDDVLCHADIHGWNLLTDEKSALYVVDWDTLIFAPKERDLMFIGAGIGDTGRSPLEEETLFYQGYGQVEINQNALAYYRYARVIEDIGEYCQHIFFSGAAEKDRLQSFEYVQANFIPNGTIERACLAWKLET